nr:hypothetical protein CFP56_52675 [Quercus suber]
MQLDTGLMPEFSAPGFYERNFSLPRKAFRDARWKPATRESGMEVDQKAVVQANMVIDVFFSDQQQFSSSLKAAPYSAKGEDIIFVPGFDEGRKSSFRGAKEVSPCLAPVMGSPRAGSSENFQSDMKVTVEEVSNKCREPLHAETVSMGKMLQREAVFTPKGTLVSNESVPNSNKIPSDENINSEILFPKSISSAELFDIQIKEINEALIKFGKQTDGEIKAKEASNAEITPQNQCDEAKEGSGAREVGLVQAHGQIQGSGRVHAQSVQQKINTTSPILIYTKGERKL